MQSRVFLIHLEIEENNVNYAFNWVIAMKAVRVFLFHYTRSSNLQYNDALFMHKLCPSLHVKNLQTPREIAIVESKPH